MGEVKEVSSLQMLGGLCQKNVHFFLFWLNIFIVARKEVKIKGRRSNMKVIPKIALFGHMF